MNRDDRPYVDDESECPVPRGQGNLLLQFAVIGSGRVPNTSHMQVAARGVVNEVLAAAQMNGHPPLCFPDGAPRFSASTLFALFDWLDAACTAAGPEVVEEIFYRPKQRQLQ